MPRRLAGILGLIMALEGAGTLFAGGLPPGPPECGTTTATFTQSTPVAIPTGPAVVTSTIVVSGVTGGLWDVNVLTNLVHTFAADLDVTVTSPAGTVVTLTTDNGAGNDNVFNGTVWDDDANPAGAVPYTTNNGLVTDHAYVNLTTATPLVPEEGLSAFRGQDPNGTWTITISDDLAGDGGSLDSWALTITSLNSNLTVLATLALGSSAPVAIPTGPAVVTSTIDMSPSLGTFLCRTRLTTNLTHTFAADLDITLTSPAGTVVTLTTDNGAGNDNVFNGTQWREDANPGGQVPYVTNDGVTTDNAYVNLTPAAALTPEESFGAFMGEDPRGIWTLTISDDLAGDGGSLDSWVLQLQTCGCAHGEQDDPVRVDEHASAGSSNLNGVFELGETVLLEPAWHNPGATPFLAVASTSGFGGPAGPSYSLLDFSAGYGTLSSGATVNCFDATGDCYQVQITGGPRPVQHWDASINESFAEVSAQQSPEAYQSWALHVGGSFADVPTSNNFYRFIETLFHRGITGGCSPSTNYCPSSVTLRQQMAVFVLKAKEGAAYVPPAAVGIFTDVPAGNPFAPWIEELYNRGVVSGCGPGPAYCPGNPVLRQQMAVFLLKTLMGSGYTPPAAAGIFGDVPMSHPFAPWIEDIFNRGIAAGCGSGNFCPGNGTTRGQMAPFLVKTLGLTLYGP